MSSGQIFSPQPLVSITMPCYNARDSLPWALASCLAQTYANWELVLVDDGSTDHPEEIVAIADDERIRLVTLPENRGRGYARQVALDNARGEFVCMLDADDWMYPDRIEQQVRLLQQHPEVDLVSSGMAICDQLGNIVGVRGMGTGNVSGPLTSYQCPVVHAASMFRRSASLGVRYNPDLHFGEDSDFLARMLMEKRFVKITECLYAYEEFDSVTASKAAKAMKHARIALRANVGWSVGLLGRISYTYLKQIVYHLGSILKLDAQLLMRRSNAPTQADLLAFTHAKGVVETMVEYRFQGMAS